MSRQYGEPCLVIEGNSGTLSSTNWGNFYLYLLLVHSFWCPDMFRYIDTRHFLKILPCRPCRCRCDSADTGVRCVQCPVTRRRHTLGSTPRTHRGHILSTEWPCAGCTHTHYTHLTHVCHFVSRETQWTNRFGSEVNTPKLRHLTLQTINRVKGKYCFCKFLQNL